MTDRPDLHIDDVDVPIIFLVRDRANKKQPLPLQSATSLQLRFRKPSGDVVVKTASLYTDGSDGKMQYITESGFLDEDGTWSMQAMIEDDSGAIFTDIENFDVGENIPILGS